MRGRPVSFRQCAVWAVVLGGHILLIVLFPGMRSRDARHAESEEPTVLLFLDLAPPPEPEKEPTPQEKKNLSHVSVPREAVSAEASDSAISEEVTPARPRVDWHQEAEVVAQSKAAELYEKQKTCDASGRPGSTLPPCKKKSYEAQWEPEPNKFGTSGGLPYVRLGKRCLVGLGFFGCALGKLPEANGHLFDDMKDPDRPQSSVPDIPTN